jgi:serine protease DegS
VRSSDLWLKLVLAAALGMPAYAALDRSASAGLGETPSASRHERPAIVSFRDAVAQAAPSVVSVYSVQESKSPLPLTPKAVVNGLGSGVILDSDGFIVTNYHVVQAASTVAVVLVDGTLHAATIVGADRASDIAVVKVDADGLQFIRFADIEDVAVGDVVLAVGNPLGIGQTVTQGIVSAIVRKGLDPVQNFVQTDAAVNPGNSGGALVDTTGRLIGINTMILSHSGGSEGIGFAIPGDYVQTIVAELKSKGRVSRAWLGLSTSAYRGGHGVLVQAVENGGPADRAGIVPGDVVVQIGDRSVERPQQLRAVVIGVDPGTRVPIELLRNGVRTRVEADLAPLPASTDAMPAH